MRRRANRSERNPIAVPSLSKLLRSPARVSSPVRVHLPTVLAEVEDRRTYHPERATRPARYFSGPTHRLKIAEPKKTRSLPGLYQPSPIVAFESPKNLPLCVRRKQRREIIHALKKIGKGARARRRRNDFSNISCR